jgi:hypothetical protein
MILPSLAVVRGGSHVFWHVGILCDMEVASVCISLRVEAQESRALPAECPKRAAGQSTAVRSLSVPGDN